MVGIKHYTMRERASQITWVKNKIVALGGWFYIQKDIGEKTFALYVAAELGCKRVKAQEYIDMAVKGSLAVAVIEKSILKRATEFAKKAKKK